jgi:hypothetical protein
MRNSENAPRWRADAGRGRETDVLTRAAAVAGRADARIFDEGGRRTEDRGQRVGRAHARK